MLQPLGYRSRNKCMAHASASLPRGPSTEPEPTCPAQRMLRSGGETSRRQSRETARGGAGCRPSPDEQPREARSLSPCCGRIQRASATTQISLPPRLLRLRCDDATEDNAPLRARSVAPACPVVTPGAEQNLGDRTKQGARQSQAPRVHIPKRWLKYLHMEATHFCIPFLLLFFFSEKQLLIFEFTKRILIFFLRRKKNHNFVIRWFTTSRLKLLSTLKCSNMAHPNVVFFFLNTLLYVPFSFFLRFLMYVYPSHGQLHGKNRTKN